MHVMSDPVDGGTVNKHFIFLNREAERGWLEIFGTSFMTLLRGLKRMTWGV